ncbi:MAG: hypothetical protein BWY66_01293 [bacterium ADurb.Bin374]|nr:MAG: hypothetical protein BWY66_01293 [bacterium ADurb.Bin374]
MNKYIYIIVILVGGCLLPAIAAEQARLDEGLSTIRVVAVSEETHNVICLPVGIVVHAPEDPAREPIVMRVGGDVSVNARVAIVASSTETEELNRRVIRELGPEYTIDYCKNPSWALDVKTGDMPLASRAMTEGALSGWTFIAMIPAELASPAVSLNFSGEIRSPSVLKKGAAVRSVRTVTMSDSSSTSTSGDMLTISRTDSSAETTRKNSYRHAQLSSATFPLTGSWEKTIVPER